MKPLHLIISAGIFILAGCHRHQCPLAQAVTRTQLFVFAGQSNMTGFPPYNTQVSTDPRIRYLNDPMNGPAVPFLKAYIASHPGQRVAAITYAVGGTGMWQWTPGNGGLYEWMAAGVTQALKDNADVDLAGFIFYQGECDASPACKPTRLENWGVGFKDLVSTMRGAFGVPYLPVVFAQIGSTDDRSLVYIQDVRDQQTKAQLEIPGSIMIQTVDLGRRDQIHLTDESYSIVGQRMATAYDVVRYPGCSDEWEIGGISL